MRSTIARRLDWGLIDRLTAFSDMFPLQTHCSAAILTASPSHWKLAASIVARKHDPEKCVVVFRKDHAQIKNLGRDGGST
jgi:hypothetical protein